MQIFHQLVFDDSVNGTTTVYTDREWDELLATTEVIVVAAYTTQVSVGGGTPTLTVQSQVSGDGRTWSNLAAAAEINAQTLDTAAQTSLTAWTSFSDKVTGFRRLAITLGGTSPRGRLQLFVTGRHVVPSTTPDFIWVKRASSAQTGIGANTTIDFNTVGPSRTVFVSGSAIILSPGKTYRLTLNGWLDNFSNADGLIDMRFVDDANNPLVSSSADSPTARFRPQSGTTQASQSAGCQMIYRLPPDATTTARSIKVRTTASAVGTADVPQNGLTLIAEEIPGSVMRIYHELVFEDSIDGTTTVYTNPEFNSLLATTERLVISAYVTQTSGTTPSLTVRTQDSGDNRSWKTNQATAEINAATLDTAAQTSILAQSIATGPISGFRRLEIALAGTAPSAHVCIYVTGRAEEVVALDGARTQMRSGGSDFCSQVQKCRTGGM